MRSGHTADGRVQRALAGLYDRRGARLIYVVYAANIVVGLLIGVVTLIWTTRYLALPVTNSAVIAAVLLLGGGPGAALVLWSWRDAFRTGLSWMGEARTPQRAPEVWESLARLPYVVARRTLLSSCVLMVPFTILAVVAMGRSWLTAIPFYGCTFTAVLTGAVLWTFGTEFALRPMLRDVASMLPADFEPVMHGWRLQTKSLLPLPVVSSFGALTAGAFVDATDPGALRLAVALGIALLTAFAVSVIFFVITRSTLDPIEDLLDATQRVRAGDISTSVPLVSADEFGRLAYSFNAMLGDLRRHRDALRATHARIVTAADAARRGVERDLHDGAQQRLVLLHLKLGVTAGLLERDPTAAGCMVQEMRADLACALTELQDVARGLYPALLEIEGLRGALTQAAERSAIPVTLDCDRVGRFAAELEAAVYFCCLEALQNASKHAGERASVTVGLKQRGGALAWQVADDGRGFDSHVAHPGCGLLNMTDRIVALGGQLQIVSRPGTGTTVSGTLPIPHEHE